MSSRPLPAAERDICLQARRGLAIYFAVLVPLSAAFEALMILGNLSWFWALMWTPAAASVVARLILREGFADVSFRIGGRRGWKAVVLALVFPIIVGLISYGTAWVTGLVHFSPQPIPIAAQFVGDNSSPVLVFLVNLAVAATVVTILSVRTAAGEEIGWRGYMIIPLGSTRDTQSLVEIDKTDTGIAKRPLLPVRFVPLLHGRVKPDERS